MLRLIVLLGLLVAHGPRHRTTHSSLSAIRDTATQVAQLALRLARLALLVLLAALLLQAFGAGEVAHGFFGGAEGLVPAAGLAVRVVLGDAGAAEGDAADGGAGVGGRVFGVGFALLVGGLLLVGCVACDGAESGLGGAGGLWVEYSQF